MEWSYGLMRPLVERVAARKIGMFALFHAVDEEDLVQETLLATCKAHGSFDPQKAGASSYHGRVGQRKLDPKYATFMYTVAMRRILDLWRQSSRQAARDALGARPAAVWPEEEPIEAAPLEEEALAEWLASTYRQCRHAYEAKTVRIGRKHYRVPKVAAVLLLMQRLNLSPQAARSLLASRPDLRKALRLVRTPGRRYFRTIANLIEGKRGEACRKRQSKI